MPDNSQHESEHFSKRLGELRNRFHLTQSEVAAHLGVSRNYVSMLENGRAPGPKLVSKLSSLLLTLEANKSHTAQREFSQGNAEAYLLHDGVPLDVQIQTQLEGATLMAKRALEANPERKDHFVKGVLVYCGAMKKLLEEEPKKEGEPKP